MKRTKNVLIAFIGTLFLMAVGYFYSNRESLSVNDLAIANVEAIASGETDSMGKWIATLLS